ncbi:hypothetical protein JMJ56_32700 [Belnapia sp. T18]|uniref:Uncharacterized protein n=1 Tax=Belnapia arida TaxID=2804533 RepID=A0ABS1UFE9_9PROT|nr:hypothetical protein [Belnapia arida]MBL6082719.1 hypothetical protein [Belnapia arida]
MGQREFAAKVSWGLPNPAPPGATSLLDVVVIGCRQGDLVDVALAPLTRFIELDAAAWTNKTARVKARNISLSATFNLTAIMDDRGGWPSVRSHPLRGISPSGACRQGRSSSAEPSGSPRAW